ncbi:GerMN domain-containing protein [Bacillus sp. FJAT-44742]|uniref:GerMN domain-containing protein n=1 Tax=Bacillus sp. FJAT-44742 TaxID=2014005 RepID=UPI000C246A17|nr:GerMN domain-containing protein [Bacillus sp. FJAT-44742]
MKKVGFIIILSSGIFLAACGQGTTPQDAEYEEEVTGDEETVERSEEESVNNDEGTEDEGGENGLEEETTEEDMDGNQQSMEEEQVTDTVLLYFSDQEVMEIYYEEHTLEVDSEDQLPVAALQQWIEGPEHERLTSIVNEDTDVQWVEEEGNTAVISFNPALLESNLGSTAEKHLTEQMASIMEQFGFSQIKILIDGEEQDTLFGHFEGGETFSSSEEHHPITE